MKTVLVTGASSGIGRSIVMELAKHDYQVYAGVRKQQDFDEYKEFDNPVPLFLDVTDGLQIDRAVDLIQSQNGLDVLINNAGIGLTGSLLEIPMDRIRFQFDVNVLGPIRMIQAFRDQLITNQGRIINISSMNGHAVTKFGGAYNMSKFAMEAMGETLALELDQLGVKITTISPGVYRTSIFEKLKPQWEKEAQRSELFGDDFATMVEGYDPSQVGRDPKIVAEEVATILENDEPPLRKLSGSDREKYWVYGTMIQRIQELVSTSSPGKSLQQIIEELRLQG